MAAAWWEGRATAAAATGWAATTAAAEAAAAGAAAARAAGSASSGGGCCWEEAAAASPLASYRCRHRHQDLARPQTRLLCRSAPGGDAGAALAMPLVSRRPAAREAKGARLISGVAAIKDHPAGLILVALNNGLGEGALPLVFCCCQQHAVLLEALPVETCVTALLDVARRVTRR